MDPTFNDIYTYALVNKILGDEYDYYADLSEDGKDLLEECVQTNDVKSKAALFINALDTNNIINKGGGYCVSDYFRDENFIDFGLDSIVSKYDNFTDEELNEIYDPEFKFQRITSEMIREVELDNGIPKSIVFGKLGAPVISLAFNSFIKEIRFGTSYDFIYNESLYEDTKMHLQKYGFMLPENVFQIHWFMVYIQKFLYCTYIKAVLQDFLGKGLTGIFDVINILQAQFGKEYFFSNYEDNVDINSYLTLDGNQIDIDSKLITDIATRGLGDYAPCERYLVITDEENQGIHNGMLYNAKQDRFMGVYHQEWGDKHNVYKSLPDFLFYEIRADEADLLTTVLRTYISDNKIDMDDGMEFLIEDDECTGLIDTGYLWSEDMKGFCGDEIETGVIKSLYFNFSDSE